MTLLFTVLAALCAVSLAAESYLSDQEFVDYLNREQHLFEVITFFLHPVSPCWNWTFGRHMPALHEFIFI
ncbi:hypothetical protein OESDEN_00627 [Oesophagostomum dentatum]|uniref:Uncharacterized protein n=1 Tax=Oesophagostomum dentatum TaxID=61180 RepID=A0A0B1TQ35_OESDE|nr:hypothetical protein OESDEN_00627 [Oesophagostomum dentatum]